MYNTVPVQKSRVGILYKPVFFSGSLFATTEVASIILLHEKFLQFDWLRAVVFQLNLKYLRVKITNLLRVVV